VTIGTVEELSRTFGNCLFTTNVAPNRLSNAQSLSFFFKFSVIHQRGDNKNHHDSNTIAWIVLFLLLFSWTILVKKKWNMRRNEKKACLCNDQFQNRRNKQLTKLRIRGITALERSVAKQFAIGGINQVPSCTKPHTCTNRFSNEHTSTSCLVK
jgi:hypothetical protein